MKFSEWTRFSVTKPRSLAMFFPVPLEMKLPEAKPLIPVANTVLIVVNVLVYLLGGCGAVGSGTAMLTVVSYGFCHLGLWHLVLNMWVLWVFGNPVNRRLGNALYLAVYLGCLMAVGLFAKLFLPVGLIGSSGAVFAVIAIALILMPRAVVKTAYLAVFPITLPLGLLKRPKYGLNWFVNWGIVSVPALWCLVLIPLMEFLSFFWRAFYYGWSWTPGAHLLGMFCGVAAVLILPNTITMRRRSWVDGL
jgi:membrane associated rhomboid family serine protease